VAHSIDNMWFPGQSRGGSPALRLFCFPFAGGSAMVFREWPDLFPPAIEVCPVELPGHGRRLEERPFGSMDALVNAIALALTNRLPCPYAFFGHSMGAAVSFALAHRLRELGTMGPMHLFLSGRRGPKAPADCLPLYNLPEPEFVQELRRLGGTPQEILGDPEALAVLLPVLRADFELVHTWNASHLSLLACPITAMGGTEDEDVSEQDLKEWSHETAAGFSLNMFRGGHFYLRMEQRSIARLIANELQPFLSGADSGRAASSAAAGFRTAVIEDA